MSMFKKIKSLFVVEEDRIKKTSGSSDHKAAGHKVGKRTKITDRHSDSDKASVDQFLQILATAMEKNNLEGYDYLEYREAVRSLDKLEEDENKKYVTAFALAKTMGAQKASLKESASFYIKILAEEEEKFNAALQKQVDEKLNAGNLTIKKLEEEANSKKERIIKLEKEIKSKKEKISKLRSEVEESANKVATVKNSFHLAYSTIVDQIKKDLQKIDDYIK